MEKYSVLMSVYHKEVPAYFRQSLQSMMDQTVATDDFVLVCDGPLTEELDAVIQSFTDRYPDVFHVIRLPENVGIGSAANIGLQYCKNDLVAKMDADDISVPHRCEKQLEQFERVPHLAVTGGFIEEFEQNPEEPFALRIVPTSNADIRKFARRRQPFNNMTVMYRRAAVLAIGGYRDYRRCEDYDVYLRLLHADYYAENLAEVLVKARVNKGAISRRASKETLRGIIRSRRYAMQIGYSSVLDFLICVGGELVILACPDCVRRFIYNKFLRRRA